MKTILVSGASNLIGYGVLNSLRCKEELKLIGMTMYRRSVAPAFCDALEIVPKTLEPDYLPTLISIIKKYNVDMLIPSFEDDVICWNQHSKELMALGTFPLLNNPELITLCVNKWAFYEKLKGSKGAEYAIPTFITQNFDTLPTPFLIKPIRGWGSRGIVKIKDIESFNKHKNDIGSIYIMQPIEIGRAHV